MKTSVLSSLLPPLLLCSAACNGAIPSGPGTSAGPSETTGASNGSGPGTGTGSTSAGQNTTGASLGTGSASGGSSGSGSSAAGASTGQAGSTGGTSGGISTGSGTGSGGKGSGTGGSSTGGAACVPACAGKLSCCNGTCVDLTGDSFNCGVCGKLCAAGDYCNGSACVAAGCPSDGCNGAGGCCGGRCCDANQVCCLDNGPVELFLCEDPDAGSCPVGCAPTCVSRRDAKRDIEYLDEAQLRSAEEQVLRIPLARFNYKWDAPTERRRLGFIIDDVAPSPGVIDEARGEVDLYGYTSLAVAALQEQGKELERLRKQVAELQKRLDRPHPPKRQHPPER